MTIEDLAKISSNQGDKITKTTHLELQTMIYK